MEDLKYTRLGVTKIQGSQLLLMWSSNPYLVQAPFGGIPFWRVVEIVSTGCGKSTHSGTGFSATHHRPNALRDWSLNTRLCNKRCSEPEIYASTVLGCYYQVTSSNNLLRLREFSLPPLIKDKPVDEPDIKSKMEGTVSK